MALLVLGLGLSFKIPKDFGHPLALFKDQQCPTIYAKKSSHLWLVPIGVQHHYPVRAIVAVAEAELLHEDFVLTVFPSLNDHPLHQLLFTEIHL